MSKIAVAVWAALATASAAVASNERDDLSAEDRARVAKVTAPARDFSSAEPFETLPAGAGTTRKMVNADIFSHPSANLTFEGRQEFLVGNGLFRKDWVSAPSSTQASDGLGPLFNARSCQACHTKDGRGTVPGFDPLERTDAVALLMRLAVPPHTEEQRRQLASGELPFVPEPVYGSQLQNFAVAGLPAEGRLEIEYEPVAVELNGGETATLMKPTYRIEDPAYGPMRDDMQMSPRLAPPMIGLGLLEAVHPA
ncbi:MAG TPA: di-heme oxidoredictase family protein, partial [Bordetella sp.]|nr:di-heme oxidoredictase family protein [Bordetella sp.]